MDGRITCNHLRRGWGWGGRRGVHAAESLIHLRASHQPGWGAARLCFKISFCCVHSAERQIMMLEMHAPTGSALLTLESAACPNQTASCDCWAPVCVRAHLRHSSESGRELRACWKIMQWPSEGLRGSGNPEIRMRKNRVELRLNCPP